jgi:hypothetical protein
MRRAVKGVERPMIPRGQVATTWIDEGGNYVPEGSPKAVQLVRLTIREYSDTLLIFLLRAARPEKYRERRHLSVETQLPRLQGGRPVGRPAMDDPTIRRLTAEICAILEENRGSP